MSAELVQAIAVTAELTGTPLTEAGAEAMAIDLAEMPRSAVLVALRKCRRELKGRLTLSAVIERIDDGRPGAEEAWAMMPFDEAQSVVWSDEMAQAFGICGPLLDRGDKVAARMAFKEAYAGLVARSRDAGVPVRWTPSLGHDAAGRAAVINRAVEAGRLSISHATDIAPLLIGNIDPVASDEARRAALTAIKVRA